VINLESLTQRRRPAANHSDVDRALIFIPSASDVRAAISPSPPPPLLTLLLLLLLRAGLAVQMMNYKLALFGR